MSQTEIISAANKSFSDLADKVEHLLGQAWQLQPADQKHISIAMEMGQALVTVLLPLILSAAAELQEHVNANNTGMKSPPVWMKIRVDDLRIKGHPLFPSTLNYRPVTRPQSPPTPGPSRAKENIPAGSVEQHGRGTERRKRSQAPSTRSRSRPALTKRRLEKSKAILSSEDELEEEEVGPKTALKKLPVTEPKARPGQKYVEVTSKEESDTNESIADVAGPQIAHAASIVLPNIPITSGPDLTEDDFADTSAPVWTPHCGQCVAWDLICRQGFNKGNHRKLRLKIKCSGKGSEAPKVKAKTFATCRNRSQSWCCASPPAEENVQNSIENMPAPAISPAAIPMPSSVSHQQEMQNLNVEVDSLRALVLALQTQVVATDGKLQDAATRLVAQEQLSHRLTEQIESLHRQLYPAALEHSHRDSSPPVVAQPTPTSNEASGEPVAGASPPDESACLPVVMKDSAAEGAHVHAGQLPYGTHRYLLLSPHHADGVETCTMQASLQCYMGVIVI
ncbi:uncharacterized protein F5147DRAFT_654631 [Suillus discolor]|uniref:Uncharacterized protein n=1 Tax=Suillus discolor TaxID=1912936 RepID=A0A9P7F1W9_9AGAM|nr:uncharacterized protein F5147DRAFT_654631 [Suillus discolor]KAG2103719.1 hypothetical protein F5147DRAFT_654631 [Suillus discolor]